MNEKKRRNSIQILPKVIVIIASSLHEYNVDSIRKMFTHYNYNLSTSVVKGDSTSNSVISISNVLR